MGVVSSPYWITTLGHTPLLRYTLVTPLVKEYFPEGVGVSPSTLRHIYRKMEEIQRQQCHSILAFALKSSNKSEESKSNVPTTNLSAIESAASHLSSPVSDQKGATKDMKTCSEAVSSHMASQLPHLWAQKVALDQERDLHLFIQMLNKSLTSVASGQEIEETLRMIKSLKNHLMSIRERCVYACRKIETHETTDVSSAVMSSILCTLSDIAQVLLDMGESLSNPLYPRLRLLEQIQKSLILNAFLKKVSNASPNSPTICSNSSVQPQQGSSVMDKECEETSSAVAVQNSCASTSSVSLGPTDMETSCAQPNLNHFRSSDNHCYYPQPLPVQPGSTTSSQPLPVQPGSTTSSQPLPVQPGSTSSFQPLPVHPGTSSQPLPVQPGSTTSSPPLPVQPGSTTSSQPLPVQPGSTTSSPPLPVQPGSTTSSPPLPVQPGSTTSSPPLPVQPGSTTSSLPLPVQLESAACSQPLPVQPGSTANHHTFSGQEVHSDRPKPFLPLSPDSQMSHQNIVCHSLKTDPNTMLPSRPREPSSEGPPSAKKMKLDFLLSFNFDHYEVAQPKQLYIMPSAARSTMPCASVSMTTNSQLHTASTVTQSQPPMSPVNQTTNHVAMTTNHVAMTTNFTQSTSSFGVTSTPSLSTSKTSSQTSSALGLSSDPHLLTSSQLATTTTTATTGMVSNTSQPHRIQPCAGGSGVPKSASLGGVNGTGSSETAVENGRQSLCDRKPKELPVEVTFRRNEGR